MINPEDQIPLDDQEAKTAYNAKNANVMTFLTNPGSPDLGLVVFGLVN